ncbi:MAG TPA: hypothetical protein VFE29_07800 [Terriglobia bacterium]|nr:hypothetical protein [Terriglobia bacterium]
MNPVRFATFLAVTLSLGTLAAGTQRPPARTPETGLRFIAGPADGLGLATAAAASQMSRSGSSRIWQLRPPIALYALQSDDIATGKGIEKAEPCGFQYLVESPDKHFLGTVEVHVDAECAARMPGLGKSDTGFQTYFALNNLAAEGEVKANSYEPRLIYAKLKPGLSSSLPELVAVWLKSPKKDLIYPLKPGTLNIGGGLYPAEEFFKKLRPALADVEWSSDYAMHTYFTERFLESRGNGPNRMLDEPMRLQDSMRLRLTSAPSRPSPVETYKLLAVELIGVAMHETPEAFTSAKHRGLPVHLRGRPLTAFEERALLELTAGETAAVYTDDEGRFVVGALRAKEECLYCHRAYKDGDLLGALSYRLIPAERRNSAVAVNLR